MKSHVWRPLFVVAGVVCVILAARLFAVPSDFGIHDQGYMYGFHRLGNEADWKAFKPRYRFDTAYCRGCHEEKAAALLGSPHKAIPCEDCHGPADGHPDDPPKLPIDWSRGLCLRCHAHLPYPTSGRAGLPGIDPKTHNPELNCVDCHDPHHPHVRWAMKGARR